MTREELIYEVCPYKSMIDCHSEEPYTHFKCKDCSILMNKWFDEYDKHVIEQYKANTGLKDTIKDIHDNVAREMYCKGIDEFANKLNAKCNEMIKEKWNSNVAPISWAEAYANFKDDIDEIAEQLKAGVNNE